MFFLIATIVSVFLSIIFLILWLKERKHASEVEIVAYGLRSEDDSDENTKTSISAMEEEYNEALDRLKELGELKQDNWGRWIWTKTGEQLGGDH